MSNKSVFSASKVKSFRGHEGELLVQGTLCRDGKVVGDWSEHPRGGGMEFNFIVPGAKDAFAEWAKTYLLDKDCLGEPYKIDEMSNWELLDAAFTEIAAEEGLILEAKRYTKNGVLAFELRDKYVKGQPMQPTELIAYKTLLFCDANIERAKEELKDKLAKPTVTLTCLNELIGQKKLTNEEALKQQEENTLKGWCKTKIVVAWKDTPDSKIVHKTLKVKYSKEQAFLLRQRYPHNIVEVINERFI